ncbi:molybdate ABC transporter substrate-binding protein [Stappia sp.]|jgi:molybdate transport system substrate-binding protein|uniref:molybdate ABC transporter substrate-binding protein n=1 Tax=Stappia sp. TaxID=1870903 RepID=UPI003A98E971
MSLKLPSSASLRAGILAFALACGLGGTGNDARADDITVFAAASLKNAMDEIAPAFATATGDRLVVSLAGSSALARQIQAGAPADLFISANVKWMDTLAADGLIRADTRVDLLANSIVLIAHGKDAGPVEIARDMDLPGLLGEGRLAMALVDAVPAGIYGKAALTSLGLWDAVEPSVAQADNVRAALALVSSGEAPYGIVYATDAAADDNVTVVATFPADTHPAIIYPAALTQEANTPAATKALAFLRGAEARKAFERQGFVVLD